jgi:hypothetical protein
VSMLFLNSWRVSSHIVRYDINAPAIQNQQIDNQEKLRLNLHSLSVSVSQLLEYGRKCERTRERYSRIFKVDLRI